MNSSSHEAPYTDYLAAEQASEARHEFIDGVIVAMGGGSDEGVLDTTGKSLLRRSR